MSIAQFSLALSTFTLPSVSDFKRIDETNRGRDWKRWRQGYRTLKEEKYYHFFFPAAASAARFSSAVRGNNKLVCFRALLRSHERGRWHMAHTLPLLLAHDSSSILLGPLELSSRQGVLGFLDRRAKPVSHCRIRCNQYRAIGYNLPTRPPSSGPWPDQCRAGYHGSWWKFRTGLDSSITIEKKARTRERWISAKLHEITRKRKEKRRREGRGAFPGVKTAHFGESGPDRVFGFLALSCMVRGVPFQPHRVDSRETPNN